MEENVENKKEKDENNKEKEDDIDNIHMEIINDSNIGYKYIFRICLLGDSGVGKTSLLTRFVDRSFTDYYHNTIGVDFRVVTLKYKDIISKVHIWDTAGQERFKSIAVNYFRSTHGFIFVYDITDDNSFSNIESWINLAFNNSSLQVVNFLVGNKSDEESQREVDKNKAMEFAQLKNLNFLETSAKNNDNVEKLFEYFTYKLIEYFSNNKDKYIVENHNNTLDNYEEIQSDNENNKKCAC